MPRQYRDFTITPRTYQIRGSERWSLDLVIQYRDSSRAFSGPETFATEADAVKACYAFGQKIIDGEVPNYAMDDLV